MIVEVEKRPWSSGFKSSINNFNNCGDVNTVNRLKYLSSVIERDFKNLVDFNKIATQGCKVIRQAFGNFSNKIIDSGLGEMLETVFSLLSYLINKYIGSKRLFKDAFDKPKNNLELVVKQLSHTLLSAHLISESIRLKHSVLQVLQTLWNSLHTQVVIFIDSLQLARDNAAKDRENHLSVIDKFLSALWDIKDICLFFILKGKIFEKYR